MITMDFNQKILIIRFSSIGDVVLATSPLSTIRTAYPDSEITFLTLDKFAPLLEFHPHVDRLLSIPSNSSIRYLWEFSRYLDRNAYGLIYDMHNSLRSNIVTFHSKSQTYQLRKPRFNRMMLFHFHENYFQSQFSARSMYHEHLGPIWNGDHDTIPPSLLRLSGSELEKGKSSLINRGVIGEYIAVMPEAAWRQKQWRSERYIEVLNKLDMPSVLIGSKIGGICTDIQKGLEHSTDLSGQTSLRDAMSIIANAKHVIGSDTGLVHAAEALGKTVSMILGPTSTETGAGVSLDSSINIEKDLWCRPCSQNGSVPCYRKQQYCMESITPQDVLDSLQIKL